MYDADHRDACVGAEHVQFPVREVHHAEEPEDDRQAQRQQPQRGPEHEAVQELWQQDRQDVVHRATVSSSF
jgi:hypothetical protein